MHRFRTKTRFLLRSRRPRSFFQFAEKCKLRCLRYTSDRCTSTGGIALGAKRISHDRPPFSAPFLGFALRCDAMFGAPECRAARMPGGGAAERGRHKTRASLACETRVKSASATKTIFRVLRAPKSERPCASQKARRARDETLVIIGLGGRQQLRVRNMAPVTAQASK